MSEPAHMERLSPCPKCGGENLAWCGISVRPYCRECGHWGRVNHGAANDAIEAWNSSASRAEANADMRRENRRLAAEVERLRGERGRLWRLLGLSISHVLGQVETPDTGLADEIAAALAPAPAGEGERRDWRAEWARQALNGTGTSPPRKPVTNVDDAY